MRFFLNRKIILTLSLVCGLFFSVHQTEAGTLVRPPNNLGLVGYWSFNEGTSTVATDYSGNGNNGTLTNIAAPATDVSGWAPTGKFSSALTFDGSNDYVGVGGFADAIFTNSWSQALWIKGTTTNNLVLTEKGTNNAFIQTIGVGQIRVGATGASAMNTTGSPAVNDGSWHHITVTYDGGTNSLITYIDGAVRATSTASSDSASSATAYSIGSRLGSAAFPGQIDEVRVYNRTLTATQVTALYNSGASKFGGSNALTQGSLNSGLMGHWTFDGRDMVPNVRDVSGNGNHGTLANFAATTSVMGTLGQSLDFNNPAAGGSDYVNAGSAASLDNLDTQGGGGMTAVFWMKPRTAGGFGQGNIIAKDNSGVAPGAGPWAIRHSGVTFLRFEKSFSTTVLAQNSVGSYVADEWQLAAVTWDGTSDALNGVKFYRNGALVPNGGGTTDGQGTKDSDAGSSIFIGNPNRSYDGALDDVRVYNRVLSAAEIKQLYNLAQGKTNASSTALSQGTSLKSGLVGLWTFDGADTVSSITDRSGQGNNGQFVGGATSSAKTIGKLGQALTFDGVNDYVSITDSDSLTPAMITIAGWYKQSTGGALPYYIHRADGNNRIDIFVGDAFYCTFSTGSTFNNGSYVLPTAAKTGWHQLVCTWDGQNVRSYIDGVLVLTDPFVGTLPNINAPLQIGNRSGTQFFSGAVDDIRVYSRVLSDAEVKQLYQMGQ